MKSNGLKVVNLKVYAKSRSIEKEIVKGISFSIHKGESLAIVGESGCGKTMTVMSMFQLLPGGCYSDGEIWLDDIDLSDRRNVQEMRGRDIVLIPQSGMEFLNPVFKVKSQIYETLKLLGVQKKQWKDRAIELLTKVGLENPQTVMEQYPFEISGGMAQRVILAIGIAADPKIIVADEPTRGIDSEGVDAFIELLETVFADKILIVVTHNIKVAEHCSDMLVMYNGEIMELGDSKQILSHAVHPYSADLLHAVPTDKEFLNGTELYETRRLDEGGCPYYTRCSKADVRCGKEHPDLIDKEGVWRRCFYA